MEDQYIYTTDHQRIYKNYGSSDTVTVRGIVNRIPIVFLLCQA